MKRSLAALILLGGLSLMAIAGCSIRGGYYATVPPPAPRYGVLGYAPAPGFVWTDGYYDYRYNRYNWVPGRWLRPPRRGAQWTPGQWSPYNRGYRFRKGYWR